MDFWTLLGILGMYNSARKQLQAMPEGSTLPLPPIRFHDGHKPDGAPNVLVLNVSITKPVPGE